MIIVYSFALFVGAFALFVLCVKKVGRGGGFRKSIARPYRRVLFFFVCHGMVFRSFFVSCRRAVIEATLLSPASLQQGLTPAAAMKTEAT